MKISFGEGLNYQQTARERGHEIRVAAELVQMRGERQLFHGWLRWGKDLAGRGYGLWQFSGGRAGSCAHNAPRPRNCGGRRQSIAQMSDIRTQFRLSALLSPRLLNTLVFARLARSRPGGPQKGKF